MTARRLAPAALPYWPRHLPRELAAAYVGASPALFDQEVKAGKWPAGEARGAKGGLLTWDRAALDMRSDARLPSADPRVASFEERRRAAELSRR